jgi:hypothetical protein
VTRASEEIKSRINSVAGSALIGIAEAFAAYRAVRSRFEELSPVVPSWDALAASNAPDAVLARACLHTLARSAMPDRSAAELAKQLPVLNAVAAGPARAEGGAGAPSPSSLARGADHGASRAPRPLLARPCQDLFAFVAHVASESDVGQTVGAGGLSDPGHRHREEIGDFASREKPLAARTPHGSAGCRPDRLRVSSSRGRRNGMPTGSHAGAKGSAMTSSSAVVATLMPGT